jgi:hypothetical protein
MKIYFVSFWYNIFYSAMSANYSTSFKHTEKLHFYSLVFILTRCVNVISNNKIPPERILLHNFTSYIYINHYIFLLYEIYFCCMKSDITCTSATNDTDFLLRFYIETDTAQDRIHIRSILHDDIFKRYRTLTWPFFIWYLLGTLWFRY